MARSQSNTVRLLAVMLLGLVMVGAPQPSAAAAPVAGGEAQAVVMPADPPSPTPSPTPETDDQNGGSARATVSQHHRIRVRGLAWTSCPGLTTYMTRARARARPCRASPSRPRRLPTA